MCVDVGCGAQSGEAARRLLDELDSNGDGKVIDAALNRGRDGGFRDFSWGLRFVAFLARRRCCD